MPDHPAETGRAARTSVSTPRRRRTSATRSGRGLSRWARSAVSSRPSATILRVPRRGVCSRRARDRRSRRPGTPRRRRAADLRDDLVGPAAVCCVPASSCTARRHSAAMSRAPSRQRGPVSTRIAAAPGGRVGGQPQHRHHVGHLGHRQQPGQTDDLHGDPAPGECFGHRRGVGVAPHQNRRGRRRAGRAGALVVAPAPRSRPPIRVRPPRRAAGRSAHGAPLGVGPRPQRPHRHRTASRIRGHRVGQVQHLGRVAPTGAQLQAGRRGAVRTREVGGEPREVGRRRPAPPVDRLDGVTHGGERESVVDAPTEQRRQRDPLGVPGVLVFVEQHHPVALPQLLPDLREPRRQPGCRRPSACRSR